MSFGRPRSTGAGDKVNLQGYVDRLRAGQRMGDAGRHHGAMRTLLREIIPEPVRCPQCGLEKKATLSLVDPELELLNGRYYLGYSWQQGGPTGRYLKPYALSVSPFDYQWLCARCNMAEGQPSMRHNIFHILADNGQWSDPPNNAIRAYNLWSDTTGGWRERIGRRAV